MIHADAWLVILCCLFSSLFLMGKVALVGLVDLHEFLLIEVTAHVAALFPGATEYFVEVIIVFNRQFAGQSGKLCRIKG